MTPDPCRLCRHLYGRSPAAGSPVLVCGMHAYGPDGDSCEDFEKLGVDAPRTARMLPLQEGVSADDHVHAMVTLGGYSYQESLDGLRQSVAAVSAPSDEAAQSLSRLDPRQELSAGYVSPPRKPKPFWRRWLIAMAEECGVIGRDR